MASMWIGRGCRPRFGGGALALPLAVASPNRYLMSRSAAGGRKGEPPPPPRALEPGERPKCVVVHCTPPRASKDARQLEEVRVGPKYKPTLMISLAPDDRPMRRIHSTQYLRQEADALMETLGFEVAMSESVRLRKYHLRTFVGRGKLADLRGMCAASGAASVFINTPFPLTALQQRHLADALNAPVRDRMMVILDIFAQRARTSEAKLQVELARAKYALSHQIRGAEASYAQQRGGVGFIFGGGEKALELKRRDLRDHIKGLQDKLKGGWIRASAYTRMGGYLEFSGQIISDPFQISNAVVKRRREEQRKQRRHSTVSLIGYTNVGKSTLLNTLTGGDSVSVMDRPFETLDTTTRALFLPEIGGCIYYVPYGALIKQNFKIWADSNPNTYRHASPHTSHTGVSTLLTDTVGFITDLPHDLVLSFRATLEEVVAADLLLLVRCVLRTTNRFHYTTTPNQPGQSSSRPHTHTQTKQRREHHRHAALRGAARVRVPRAERDRDPPPPGAQHRGGLEQGRRPARRRGEGGRAPARAVRGAPGAGAASTRGRRRRRRRRWWW